MLNLAYNTERGYQMSAPVWVVARPRLKAGEGRIHILFQGWEKPTREKITALPLDLTMMHKPYCSGSMRMVRVSGIRQVICCERCALRMAIPTTIKTIGELIMHLT